MHNGPLEVAWDVACPSPDVAHAVQGAFDRGTAPEATLTVAVTEGGVSREERYRLRDYFEAIRLGPGTASAPHVLRVVFRRLPDAGRYWRDLMVRVLQILSEVDDAISVTLAYRKEETGPEVPSRAREAV